MPKPVGLLVAGQTLTTTVGNPAYIDVLVMDGNGMVVPNASNTVTLYQLSGPGSISGLPSSSAFNGHAALSVYFSTPGADYVFSASSPGLLSATTRPITVNGAPTPAPAGPVGLAFVSQPQNGNVFGNLPPIQVAVQDVNHLVVQQSTRSVSLSLLNGSGPLSGTLTRQAVAGIATFNDIHLGTAGTNDILTATAYPLFPAASLPFSISNNPGTLTFTTQPSNVSAGQNMSPSVVVSLYDQNGYLDTNSQAMVTLSVQGGNVAFCNGSLQAQASGGVATFSSICLKTAGTGYTFQVSAVGYLNATSSAFNVLALAPTQLAFGPFPLVVQAGVDASPAFTVMATDAYGNGPLSASGSVTVEGTVAPGVPLQGTLTQPLTNGVATFSDLTIQRAGNGYQIAASAPNLGSVSSPSLRVVGGPATTLAFVQQPNATIQAGSLFAPAVTVTGTDAYGNPATGNVTMQSNVGGATLFGTLVQPLQGGTASFSNLSVQLVGSGYLLTASAAGVATTSNALSITAGPFATVAVVQQPPSSVALNTPFQVILNSTDAYGNPVSVSGVRLYSAIYGPWGDGGSSQGTLTNGIATITEKADYSGEIGPGNYLEYQCGCSLGFSVRTNTFTVTSSF